MSATPQSPLDPARFCAMMTQSYENRIPADVRAIIAAEAITPLGPKPHIADLGCGPGLWLRDVAALRPDARLAGYDRDAKMLDAARGLGLKKAKWHSADVGATDFALKPGSCDVIAAHFFIHFFADPRHLLATMHDALRPGGAFVMTGWVRSSMADFADFWATARAAIESSSAEATPANDPEAICYQRFAEFNRYTLDDIRWLLDRHGFSVRRDAMYTKNFAYLIAGTA
ncbi:MAG: methyltransferase domain-containing protein [Chloroflexota bacterium]|nr:methyltransferase domain-containing protein [Chloroflexota bacterium]